MPSPHPRIAIVRDPELDQALEAASAVLGRGLKPATLVRELALRGARDVVAADGRRAGQVEELIAWSTGGMPGTDREILDQVEELAAGLHDD